MFTKQKQEKKLNQITTVIGEETQIEGKIHIKSSIRIDGKVYGDIKCDGDITIGRDGYVERSVKARNLFLGGTMKGNAKVEDKVHIYDTGYLDGSAEMENLIIEEKGHFNGKSFMKGSSLLTKGTVIDIEKEKVKEATKNFENVKSKSIEFKVEKGNDKSHDHERIDPPEGNIHNKYNQHSM